MSNYNIFLICAVVASFVTTGIVVDYRESRKAVSAMTALLEEPGLFEKPYENAKRLNAAYTNQFLQGCKKNTIYPCTQAENKVAAALLDMSQSLMLVAVRTGDTQAVIEIEAAQASSRRRRSHNPWADIAHRAKPLVVKAAGLAGASRDTLHYAGWLLLNGDGVATDYKQAFEYLSQAWIQGDDGAATGIMKTFELLGDAPNYYLWQLRCRGDLCPRDVNQNLYSSLSAQQVLDIQSTARERNTLSVSKTPLIESVSSLES